MPRRLRHSIFPALLSRRISGKRARYALERDSRLRPSELETEAEMHACAEGEVRVRVARDVETVRILELGRIAVCRREESGEHVAAAELPSLPDHVAGREARLGHLHWRYVAQAFLDAGRHQAWIALQPAALILMRQQRKEPAGNQMGGGFLPRAEEQENHRDQFVLAELLPVSFGVAQRGDQSVRQRSASRSRNAAKIADNADHAGNGADDRADIGSILQPAQPILEPIVILLRQAEHRADDRKRQVPAEFGHEIGLRPSLKPVEKPIGDFRDHRLHRLDRAALERLIDQAAQSAVLRIVVAEHVQGQKADRPRQESEYPRLCPASRIAGIAREGLVILQQRCAGVME